MRGADYYVSGFAGARHPKARTGDLLLTTWHIGQSSKDMEVAAWRERMRRGECSRVEVTDLTGAAPQTEVIYG